MLCKLLNKYGIKSRIKATGSFNGRALCCQMVAMAALMGQYHRHGHGNMQHQCHGIGRKKQKTLPCSWQCHGTRKGKIACKGTINS